MSYENNNNERETGNREMKTYVEIVKGEKQR